MKKSAILSMENLDGYEVYDGLLEAPLSAAGWSNKVIPWRAEVDWDQFDVVMIRSPWDYQLDADKFVHVLQQIDNSKAHLDNPVKVVKWNINKHYLRDLEAEGVLILPTVWRDDLSKPEIEFFFQEFSSNEIVIKPCISAGAFDTYRLTQEQAIELADELIEKYVDRQCMIQPFAEDIVNEGEFSIFHFDGEYSHTILKTPKQDDFRVQEEYGGRLRKVEPCVELVAQANNVLQAIDNKFKQTLLYTRLDFVRTSKGFALMEAELIEPSLYFNLDPESPQRYVDAMEKRYRRLGII
ncbi:MAG: hypothetical protein OQJ89_00155 [Kangiellaceae bacterium]|nr:hypothetical protein [Kangiellaceae bacterium]MCW9015350.1 hypothetical protein [Kangiellaceae bacterium]